MNKKYLPIIGAILFASFFNTLETFAYRALPTTFWFKYHDIRPENPYYIGQELRVTSEADFYRYSEITWVDTLMCECTNGSCDDDGFDTFSTYVSSSKIKPRKGNINWVYQGAKPLQPTTCYLRSFITVHTQGGDKTQEFKGSKFDVLLSDEDKPEVNLINRLIKELESKNESAR